MGRLGYRAVFLAFGLLSLPASAACCLAAAPTAAAAARSAEPGGGKHSLLVEDPNEPPPQGDDGGGGRAGGRNRNTDIAAAALAAEVRGVEMVEGEEGSCALGRKLPLKQMWGGRGEGGFAECLLYGESNRSKAWLVTFILLMLLLPLWA